MENKLGDILPCDDKLRTTLHCDDKEKLRRKLALLQREYLRTVQRLKRAERLDAVREHVRSRITEQNLQDQRGPAVTSSPCPSPCSPSPALDPLTRTTPGLFHVQEHTGGPVDSDNSRRSQVIRFLLPSDAACPSTPEPGLDPAGGHRPSPALRLRSRSSRLRWEKKRRSAEAGRSTDNSKEGQELIERVEGGRGGGEVEKTEETEVVEESEGLLSGSESESPSLLLTHWNTHGFTGAGEMEGKERQGQEHRERETESREEGNKESESPSLLLTCWSPAIHTEGGGQDGTQSGGGKETRGGEEDENTRDGQRCGRLREENSDKDIEQNAGEKMEKEKSSDRTMEIREEKNQGPEKVGGEQDGEGAGLLASCTLVEGLLFPAEYYVRTTRRMTFSHSQPDMQAVILSQFTGGRQRRGRGRGRGQGRGRGWNRHSDQHPQTDLSSLTTSPTSLGSHRPSHIQPYASPELTSNSLSSSEMSDQISANQTNVDACTARPMRGRRRKRGRGRGKALSSRCSLSIDTSHPGPGQASGNPQPISTIVSSSQSLPGADGPEHCLISEELPPVPDNPQLLSTHTPATQPPSGADRPEPSPASACLENVYPIFWKSSSQTKKPPQMNTTSWRSLLLPSSPSPQAPRLPLPSLHPGPLVNSLANFDFQQDFHLPDDQFASLKLHKLRQVAAATAVEHFTSPSFNTRSSSRHINTRHSGSSGDQVMPFPLPLSLTPTIANSPHPTEERQSPIQSIDLQGLSTVSHQFVDPQFTDKLTDQTSPVEPSARDTPDGPRDQQPENLHAGCDSHTNSTESKSQSAIDYVDQSKDQDTVNIPTTANYMHKCIDNPLKQQPHMNSNEHSIVGQSSIISIEKQTNCPAVVCHVEEQRPTNQTEDKPANNTLSYSDIPLQETSEDTSECYTSNCSATQTCEDTDAPGECPTKQPNVECTAKDTSVCLTECLSECTTNLPTDRLVENPAECPPHPDVRTQLLLSPALSSPPCPFLTPHLLSSTLPSSVPLPSLGLTPHPATAALPLTSSPSAPPLTLPPPHSPSTQALSPPALSPCPSLPPLPSSPPPVSPSSQIQASSDPPATANQCQRDVPGACPPVHSIQSQSTGGQAARSITNEGGNGQAERTEEMAEERIMRCTHTLKAPAGGCLVDACCLPGPSGGLWVAAAGKWAVCVWDQTSTSDWSLIHTWTFNEPVISVFPVPDAVGLMCVTLGQLEIREVRLLSCSSLLQVLLCEGVVQAVVGVAKSRVVSSAHSATGSTLQLFTLSEDSSTPVSQPLASPGVCVEALAAVDGLSDALIGSAEVGRLFVWNLRTGQLLQRITLGDGLSHTACLRGYSDCGVLFVLLQHQLLSSLEEEEKEAKKKADQMFATEEKEEERKKTALFSLVATNPLSGKSVLGTRLYPPKAWSGRLCEADVHGSSVVGLSQSGSVFVWELGGRGGSRVVWAPETEGWQLARWAGRDTLVTGHHNGDLTLYCYTCMRD
ncbi:uncharacterized protein palb2 [Centroberyx affinis]|uniref:uncharacterized protein palb2 n=1 Tax=Centroberyx affinis TaxID=166261 RepID=UPI003A5C0391